MDYGVILTSLLTSTLVSAGIGAFMKYYFDRRLLQLKAISDFAEDWARQRNEALKQLGDLVYRARNAAREANNEKMAPSTLQRLVDSEQSLQEALFINRVLLEREELFAVSHTYRTLLRSLEHVLRRLQQRNDSEVQAELSALAERTYDRIDDQYQAIVTTFRHAIRPGDPKS
jgi:hypothetical protein